MGLMASCIEILNLASYKWGRNREALVAHSFRVMAKARNLDEMVVGLMHHIYASSSYARALYKGEVVDPDPEWRDALDLFVEDKRHKRRSPKIRMNDGDDLDINSDQTFESIDSAVNRWLQAECGWSSRFRGRLDRIGRDKIARNVMIHDFEDMIEILAHPERIGERNSEQLALPWKSEYFVKDERGRCDNEQILLPKPDDNQLVRPLNAAERTNLIEKYSRAIVYLRRLDDADDSPDFNFDFQDFVFHSKYSMGLYADWIAREQELASVYDNSDEDE